VTLSQKEFAMSNALLLSKLILQYTTKLQEIADLFSNAEIRNRDVTDAEIDETSLKRDAAIARAQMTIDAESEGAQKP
jgi:hypothetical protein